MYQVLSLQSSKCRQNNTCTLISNSMNVKTQRILKHELFACTTAFSVGTVTSRYCKIYKKLNSQCSNQHSLRGSCCVLNCGSYSDKYKQKTPTDTVNRKRPVSSHKIACSSSTPVDPREQITIKHMIYIHTLPYGHSTAYSRIRTNTHSIGNTRQSLS